jgi:hypothetical protein
MKQTALEDSHVLTIYQTLEKLRFPPLVNGESESEYEKEITANGALHKIDKYIQGGESRLYLLEWLICKFSELMIPRGKLTK